MNYALYQERWLTLVLLRRCQKRSKVLKDIDLTCLFLKETITVDDPLWLKFIKKLHFWSSSLVLHRGVKSYENQAISHTRPNWGANQSYGRSVHSWVHTLYYSHAARLRCELQEKGSRLELKAVVTIWCVSTCLCASTLLDPYSDPSGS